MAADRVLTAVRAAPSTAPVVLVDGRSGAGKSTLARLLVEEWGGPVQLVALDSLYPGWDGLDAGAELARRCILEPHHRGVEGVWRRWDWAAEAPAEEHRVAADRALIVEGAGILTPATAPLAEVTLWLNAPEASRRTRALDRDGDAYRPHWERWARQEERHLARDRPDELALIAVDVP
ncbi:hypothetical protein PU630_06930 [Microbacterium horticulturae]|uniref:Aminobenzoate synthetase n=1 Tax=Microbacterium horticulturae TaxID=3028316 RepID=A0ABY8C1F2_9MICO|nr:hypothetical protein [Microbacterium sp. KACC 23027]WEG10281.1 hypothetical protein PU630_06930 [Microbacterium sp. KACC 23027]